MLNAGSFGVRKGRKRGLKRKNDGRPRWLYWQNCSLRTPIKIYSIVEQVDVASGYAKLSVSRLWATFKIRLLLSLIKGEIKIEEMGK